MKLLPSIAIVPNHGRRRSKLGTGELKFLSPVVVTLGVQLGLNVASTLLVTDAEVPGPEPPRPLPEAVVETDDQEVGETEGDEEVDLEEDGLDEEDRVREGL